MSWSRRSESGGKTRKGGVERKRKGADDELTSPVDSDAAIRDGRLSLAR